VAAAAGPTYGVQTFRVVAVLLVVVSVVAIWPTQRLSEGTVRGAGVGAVAAR
jgi:hypothetical protein